MRSKNLRGIAIGTSQHGIGPFIGAKTPDFGLGFYATTWFDQAKSWANLRAMRRPGSRAVVLAFLVPRNDLAELEALVFTNEKVGYWPFVRYCRLGGAPHGRVGTQQRSYDIVYGPVSVGIQEFVVKDSDQVSFHTLKAVAKIPAVSIETTGNPLV